MIKKNMINSYGLPLKRANEFCAVLSEKQSKEIQEAVASKLREAFEIMGIDLEADHNTKETPERIAKMWITDFFVGRYSEEPKVTVFPNIQKFDQLMVVGPITVNSTCSHHFVPFTGECWIGVLPEFDEDSKLAGLSKYIRMVRHFSRRPQIQEELTKQIGDYLQTKLSPKGICVLIKSKHMCVACRGVMDGNANFITSDMRGEFRINPSLKEEFLKLIAISKEGK